MIQEVHYRPQRSWGKVMFLHVSVIPFTGGGGVSVSVPGVFLLGGLCPVGVSVPGVSVWGGGSLSRGISVMETPRTVMSGRYTSYWNAFVLQMFLHYLNMEANDLKPTTKTTTLKR